jgi:hypothetical protein
LEGLSVGQFEDCLQTTTICKDHRLVDCLKTTTICKDCRSVDGRSVHLRVVPIKQDGLGVGIGVDGIRVSVLYVRVCVCVYPNQGH